VRQRCDVMLSRSGGFRGFDSCLEGFGVLRFRGLEGFGFSGLEGLEGFGVLRVSGFRGFGAGRRTFQPGMSGW
jgi:hypothetical protein